MKYNPILDSKFWILVVDTLVSLCLFFVGKYATPDIFEDVKFAIYAIQPIILLIIASIYGGELLTIKAGKKLRQYM